MSGDWKERLHEIHKIAPKEQIKKRKNSVQLEIPELPRLDREVSFAQMMKGVQKLKNSNRHENTKPRPKPIPRPKDNKSEKGHYIAAIEEIGRQKWPPRSFVKENAGENELRRLNDKDKSVALRVDLHGLQQEEAQKLLNDFVDALKNSRSRIGEVIHGRGDYRAEGVATLKLLSRRWLISHPDVLAYLEPEENPGSVLVLIQKSFSSSI